LDFPDFILVEMRVTYFKTSQKQFKMKYKSQQVAYWFFALSVILLVLQITYGFIMAFAHLGYDGLHDLIPFNAATATHKNLLVVWILSGFMGAAYYIIPEEAENELISVPLVKLQFWSLALVGVVAVIGFHLNWWEGRKFLEIPRPLDYLVVINVLLFLYILLMTLFKGKKQTTTSLVLSMGLLFAALLYLPGMVWFDNQSLDSFFRWWVVHLWVEGVWELIMGGILAFLLIKLTGVDREVIEKWLYVIVGLTFISGILGTGHHYYYIGTPKYWLIIGGIFSALEPLAFLAMALFAVAMYRKGEKRHPNQIALYCHYLFCRGRFVGPCPHLAAGEPLDTRYFRNGDARAPGFLGRLRYVGTGNHFLLDALDDRPQNVHERRGQLRLLAFKYWYGRNDDRLCSRRCNTGLPGKKSGDGFCGRPTGHGSPLPGTHCSGVAFHYRRGHVHREFL
jgi:nitric oxide reductase large subunit